MTRSSCMKAIWITKKKIIIKGGVGGWECYYLMLNSENMPLWVVCSWQPPTYTVQKVLSQRHGATDVTESVYPKDLPQLDIEDTLEEESNSFNHIFKQHPLRRGGGGAMGFLRLRNHVIEMIKISLNSGVLLICGTLYSSNERLWLQWHPQIAFWSKQ